MRFVIKIALAIAIVGSGILAKWWFFEDAPVRAARWLRFAWGATARDIAAAGSIKGLAKDEVVARLGSPDAESPMHWAYVVSLSFMGPDTLGLWVTFDDSDRAIECKLGNIADPTRKEEWQRFARELR